MKAIRGHVDGFEGRFVSGWAICDGENTSCVVKISTLEGVEIARGRASHPREDLRAVGNGRTDIAFRIPLDAIPETDALRIAVDDVPLDGSPLAIGSGCFDGGFIVEAGVIRGAVTERVLNPAPARLQVKDQYGRIVAEGQSTYRPDRDRNRFAVGRFEFPLNPSIFGFEELELRALANGVEFARTICPARLAGYLEDLSTERCRGWLLSPDAPQTQFEIEVFCNGEKIGGGRCELPREDLKEIHPTAWRAGFDLILKQHRKRDERPDVISVRLANSQTQLFDGPFVVGEPASLISATRRAAALLRSDDRLAAEERQSLQQALADLIAKQRHGPAIVRTRSDRSSLPSGDGRRFNILIPIYKGVSITRQCIESVLATRDPIRDSIILVNDCSPDAEMPRMLGEFTREHGVTLLSNASNLGFVGSMNRALAFSRIGHVVLLNSDTRVFPGAWDEMERILNADRSVGTITAISNNATIFSYPHPSLVESDVFESIGLDELAAVALEANAGRVVDVPTGHGFCMAVRREVLDRVGHLDTRFGRGYGEENDLCQRAADLGWRNVAACAILVEHRESVSFLGDKAVLLEANMPQLRALYPEYTPAVMAYERTDDLRVARWPLDNFRLRRAREAGTSFALVVENWLDGGTITAIKDIETADGYGDRARMTLRYRADGVRELSAEDPPLLAIFGLHEDDALFETLDAASVDLVLVHQLLGAEANFIRRFGRWGRAREMKIWLHDFYTICPRVTMLNAVHRFCQAASAETCGRCVSMGGSHEASRLEALHPYEHRALFREFLSCCSEVICPSNDAKAWMQTVFPEVPIVARPHPDLTMVRPTEVRDGDPTQIVILGAIGRHKGSHRFLELAREARLSHPRLHFHVVGYTDIDSDLRQVGNVSITGRYQSHELESLVAKTKARVALFLHEWPETYSYTLSEACTLRLWPVVTELGAPVERVLRMGWGTIVPRSASLLEILDVLVDQDALDGGQVVSPNIDVEERDFAVVRSE